MTQEQVEVIKGIIRDFRNAGGYRMVSLLGHDIDAIEALLTEREELPRIPKAALDWIVGDDAGSSSKTIWAVMTGTRNVYPAPPMDPSDFGRCYRLLEAVPEWRGRLHEIVELHPCWRPLVEHWNELTALFEEESDGDRAPKLYARMGELLKGGA